MTGVVRGIVADRGFFFIRLDGDHGKGDHFGHVRQLQPPLMFHELKIGQRVQFDSETGPRGLVATNITSA